MYVSDSLFYIQHLIGGNEEDEDRQMFGSKYREIIENHNNPKPQESAEDIRERIISKTKKLTGG